MSTMNAEIDDALAAASRPEARLTDFDATMDRIEERLARIERELIAIKNELRWMKWIGGGILIMVLAIAVRIILFPL